MQNNIMILGQDEQNETIEFFESLEDFIVKQGCKNADESIDAYIKNNDLVSANPVTKQEYDGFGYWSEFVKECAAAEGWD